MLYFHIGVGLPFWAGHSWVDGAWQREAESEWPRGAADGSEFCFGVLGISDDELEPEDIRILELAYARRIRFEASVNAMSIVEVLAQVFMGGEASEHGITEDGKVFKRLSTEAGLAKMGVFL